MLKQISIKNLALIANAEVSFHKGFWAITGETGAGKSVFLSALKLLCGARAGAEIVRRGEEQATVKAIFDIAKLDDVKSFLSEREIDFEDGEIEIQREVFSTGKSKARVNGIILNLGDLQKLGEMLVQMHGQSEQTLLKNTKAQGTLIDAYAENKDLLLQVKNAYEKFASVNNQIEECRQNAEQIAQQKEFLQFQLAELKNANLRIGEEEECEAIVQESAGGEQKRRIANQSLELLMGEAGIISQIEDLNSKLQKLSFNTFADEEESFKNLVSDLKKLCKETNYSAEQIENANARIALIQKLKRKYKTDLNSLIELREKRKLELESLENSDSDIEELQKSAAKFKDELEKYTKELSKKRIVFAKKLDAEVESFLHQLAMPTAVFKTHFTPVEMSANGAEQGDFWIAPNKGEGEKPLRQSASGGELSRVLLSFKCVVAERDSVPLLIFDEVDSGISGEVAHKVGDCLQELGKYHQVLTITHLHQVAAKASGQFRVKKFEDSERTYTTIESLSEEKRIAEIARMLGDETSPTVLAHAREIIV